MTPKPKHEVVWEPVPGSSQALALDSRASHTLYFGSRGPGKTDTQLMRFKRRVGLGYGRFWRGIIFDREYKALDDIISKSLRWFPEFDDGGKFLSSRSDYKWVWPDGEELLFREFKNKDAYAKIHGQEFCLAVGELVCTDKGDLPIEQLTVGSMVLTPNGYRRVSRVFPAKRKHCVRVSVYDAYGKLTGVQRQSIAHSLLTYDLGIGEGLFSSWRTFEQCPASPVLDVEVAQSRANVRLGSPSGGAYSVLTALKERLYSTAAKLHQLLPYWCRRPLLDQQWKPLLPWQLEYYLCEPQGSRGGFVHSALDGGSDGAACYRWSPTPLQQPLSCRHVSQEPRLFHRLKSELMQPKPIRFENDLKGGEPLQVNNLSLLSVSSGLVHTREFEQSTLRHSTLNALQPYDRSAFDEVSNSSNDYLSDYDLRDARLLADKESVLTVALVPRDVLNTCHLQSQMDDWANLYKHNRPCGDTFRHPYKGKLQESALPLDRGYAVASPCGELLTIDIEVEGENCYITPSGLVNKNCFIGWNELTKWPTSECYDMAMSVNRSSFTPEKDNPKLPPIPLEVFSTTNSSGPGHSWVRSRFIDPAPYGTVVKKHVEIFNPRTKQQEVFTKTQVAIFGSYRENPYLDPAYIAELESITDENLRAAWLQGSWDIVAGGALSDVWKKSVHELPRFKVPKNWRIDRAFDWGSTHPFSVGWFAEANGEEAVLPDGSKFCPPRGSLIQIAEWYGTKEIGTNKGLVMSAADIARGIIEREKSLLENGWIETQPYPGPADNQIRDVREIDVDTIETKMAKLGIKWTPSDKSKGSRKNGLQMMRDRLESASRNEGPGLYFMDNCRASIKLLPSLPRDEDNMDDIDTTSEDHPYDMTRYRVLAGANRGALPGSVKIRMPT